MLMRVRSFFLSIVSVAAAGIALAASASAADRVTCADVQEALGDGKSLTEVRDTLGTTQLRVEACTRIANSRQEHASRRAQAKAERAIRRAH